MIAGKMMYRYVCMYDSEFCFYVFHSVAVDFLDSKSFCKNSHHIKGETLLRKRHLEILGYRVVQVRKISLT